MAEEQRQSWWKSLPGLLTAASGFVAALSGLVAGLNQLGVFRRDQPAPQVVAVAPVTGGSTSSAAPASAAGPARSTTAEGGSSTAPARAAPRRAVPAAPAPAAAPVTAPRPGPAADTVAGAAAGPQRLPKGATLELLVPKRTCAPEEGQKRFTARLVAPVKVGDATVLPANTPAILHLRRAGSPAALRVRLDSVVGPDVALAVPASDVRLRRGAASGTCLRADARIAVTLGAAAAVRRR